MAEARKSNLIPERRHRQPVFAHRRPSKMNLAKIGQVWAAQVPPSILLPSGSSKFRPSVGEKRALEKALPQSPAKSHCLPINLEFTPPHSDIPFEN